MKVPEDLRYTKNDEWIRAEGDSATVGITDYAQDQLSDIVYPELSVGIGDAKKVEELFGAVESVKAAADLYMPASGEITEINEMLSGAPETINDDPYGAGWMLKLKLSDAKELEALMDAAAYTKYIEERED